MQVMDATREEAAPLVEVRVYRDGLLKMCEWCDSQDDAAKVVEMWSAWPGTRCEIDQRSA